MGGDGDLVVTDLGRGGARLRGRRLVPAAAADAARPSWTEPYYDEGGGNIVMATYAVPVHLTRRPGARSPAVVTGDISLFWLRRLLQGLDLGETGYAVPHQPDRHVHRPPGPRLHHERVHLQRGRGARRPRAARPRPKMIAGRSGYVPFDGLRSHARADEPSWLAYTPGAVDRLVARHRVRRQRDQRRRGGAEPHPVGHRPGRHRRAARRRAAHRRLDHAAHPQPWTRPRSTLAQGDLDAPLPKARGRDEIAHLTTSFGQMRDDLEQHIDELRETTAARERIESELRIAAGIQMSLVPRTFPPYPGAARPGALRRCSSRRVRSAATSTTSSCSTTTTCAWPSPTSPARACRRRCSWPWAARSCARSSREGGSPAEVLAALNDELSAENEASMFVTMFLAVVDLRTGEVRYASAGHNRPFLVTARRRGRRRCPRVRGIALGARPGMVYDEGDAHAGARRRPVPLHRRRE